jgi:DNA-binding transcriptional LysR family regulator
LSRSGNFATVSNRHASHASFPLAARTAANFAARRARSGLGIAALPHYVAGDSLASGHLVEVLRGYALPEQEIHAVSPLPKLVPTKVQAFVAFL